MSESAVTLYGLANCDTCRKARRWFDDHGITIEFENIRESAPAACQALAALPDPLAALNRRSKTWRELSDKERSVTTSAGALKLARTHPTLIKRPLVVIGEVVTQGYAPADWERALDD